VVRLRRREDLFINRYNLCCQRAVHLAVDEQFNRIFCREQWSRVAVMERQTETDRQAGRQTDRQTDRQADRQMDRQMDKERERQRERERVSY